MAILKRFVAFGSLAYQWPFGPPAARGDSADLLLAGLVVILGCFAAGLLLSGLVYLAREVISRRGLHR